MSYIHETLNNLRTMLEIHDRTLAWLLDNEEGEYWVDLLDHLGPETCPQVAYNCGRLEGYAAYNDQTILELLDSLDIDF